MKVYNKITTRFVNYILKNPTVAPINTLLNNAVLVYSLLLPNGKLRPARDWESLNCRLVIQHYKIH
jgi:hypothetical protein